MSSQRLSGDEHQQGTPSSLEEIESALFAINPNCDRETWVQLGMALHSELGAEGFRLFDTWSRGGASYSPTDTRDVWRSIRPGKGVTIKTLFGLARDTGWRWQPVRAGPSPTTSRKPTPAEAAAKARLIWDAAQPAEVDHPYLMRKGVEPVPTLREIPIEDLTKLLGYRPRSKAGFLGGRILIGPVAVNRRLTTLELIDEQGRKSAIAGGQKAGGFWAAQLLPDGDGAGVTILVSEGVATAITAHQATDFWSVAALSCGNMQSVAMGLAARFPKARLIILSDIGEGEKHAMHAAQATGAALTIPDFGPDRLEGQTDFNDLAQFRGMDAVRVAVELAIPVSSPSGEPIVSGITAAELMKRNFPEPRWAIPGLLPEGVALLGGKPKIGKSWLALSLALGIAFGGRVLGKIPVQKGEVLYLALEDNFRRLQSRCQKLLTTENTPAPEELHLFTEWKRLDAGGAEDLDKWLSEHPDCRLVILDTLAKIRPGRSRNGDVYAEDYAVGSILKPLADRHRVAILVVHHLRKMTSDDPLELLSGTMGLSGGMDGILILQRPRGKNTVTLFVTGRDVPQEKTHALKWHQDSGLWELLGDAEECARTEEQQAILDAIRKNGGYGMTVQEIADSIEKSSETARKLIGRMVGAGVLLKSGPHNASRYSIKTSQPSLKEENENRVCISHPSHLSHVSHLSHLSHPIKTEEEDGRDGTLTDRGVSHPDCLENTDNPIICCEGGTDGTGGTDTPHNDEFDYEEF